MMKPKSKIVLASIIAFVLGSFITSLTFIVCSKRKRKNNFQKILARPVISDPSFDHHDKSKDPLSSTRPLELERGLLMQEEYWRKVKDLNVSYPIGTMTRYQLYGSEKVKTLIRQLHKLQNPNSDFDQKHLLLGVGATQILHAITFAIYTKLGKKIKVTVQTPGYLDVPSAASILHSGKIEYVKHGKIDLEIIASPNNPDGVLLSKRKGIPFAIFDRVNFWPYYILESNNVCERHTFQDEDNTVFSLPKLNGFSGSRFGYAFIRDREIYELAKSFIVVSTHGLASDAEHRHILWLEYILHNNGKAYYDFIDSMRKTMSYRWSKLLNTMKQRTDQSLGLLNTQGPNAWFKTPGQNAEKYLYKHFSILGTYGPEYGASEEYARVSLICTNNQFEELIRRLTE